MRIHRVGSITLGSILILFGSLFFCRIFIPGLSYEAVFRLWPVILILLGLETLYCNQKYEEFHYDFGAVCMMLLIGFMTVCLAYSDLFFQWAGTYPGISI